MKDFVIEEIKRLATAISAQRIVNINSLIIIGFVIISTSSCDFQNEFSSQNELKKNKQSLSIISKRYILREQSARSAFSNFLTRHNMTVDPPHYLDKHPKPSATQLQIDGRGMPQGIWAFSAQGLGVSKSNHTQFVTAFMNSNSNLWGISTSQMKQSSFLLRHEEITTSPSGKKVRFLTFDQIIGKDRVLDGGIRAVFWNDVLTTISGMVVLPSELPIASMLISSHDLENQLTSKLPSIGLGGYSLQIHAEGIHSQLGYIIEYRAKAYDGRDDILITINRKDGTIVDKRSLTQNLPATPITMKVYRPTSSAPHPSDTTTVASVIGWGTLYYNSFYFPWVDELSNRSPVPTYSHDYNWGGVLGFPYQSTSSFNDLPGTSGFQVQHASFWVQKAIHTADINFTWWPPSNSTYRNKSITLITNANSTQFGGGGCFGNELWRDDDENTGCILTASGTAEPMDKLFHEAGHAIDWKYLSGGNRNSFYGTYCDPGTSEEAGSLAEAIAGLYAQMMILQEFGTSTNFTDYEAYGNSLQLYGMPVSPSIVHQDDNSLICHAPHNPCGGSEPCETWQPSDLIPALPVPCNSSISWDHYNYTAPLIQAYWEIAHSKNCDGTPPCWEMNDGADHNEARWALFYAMKTTPASGSYWDFVANFLTYFYYDVGSTQWNNRWWVFNHHRLVGPDYGYSPCHVY